MYITRACVVWSVGGVLLTDPAPAHLHALRPGLDYAMVAPPRSKPDQWGEIHCPFPVTLTYDVDTPNAAACLRDIELRTPCTGAARHRTPLFADRSGAAYSHGFLAALLSAALTFLYGAAVASLYTFHSYRSGLATALHAAGVSDALVQLICRWMCPESLHVYRRIGTREHEGSVRKASSVDVDVIQSVNAPKVSADAGFGELVSQLQGPRSAYAQREFEAVRAHALHTVAHPRATDRGPPPAVTRAPPAQPAATPQPHTPAFAPGAHAFVPRDCWPGDPCAEHNGAGWTVYIQSVTKYTAVVTFPFTLSPSGEPFEPVRVPLRVLRALEQRSA
ncbi:hypothetical protein AB1Y20_011928 [Prymnesium parvum]|uniref:Uncharacterized protein n=1 Tax=Prymnesium parvum TaxID=97485 RepID=A0AB34IQL5_PRYPA